MAEQWYYTRNGQQQGPVTMELLKQAALQPSDLVWKEGTDEWVAASKVEGLIAQAVPPPVPTLPPPVPTGFAMKSSSKPIGVVGLLNLDNRILLGYRLCLVVAIIAAFLPWSQARATQTIMGKVDSASVSISGMDTTWGMITLLVAGAGCVLSFVKPAAMMKDKVKLGMGGVGGMIALLALIGMATAASHFGKGEGMNYADHYGNRATASAGAGFGVYLALVVGIASGALGFVNKWDE